MFAITSMPVGGAETLLVNLIRRLDRERFAPELCCLKELGPLGEVLADEIPVHHGLLSGKLDVRVLWRLQRLFERRRVDAMITVGAGDKMFWGRLAAWRARVPVVAAALHSTGWPDGVGRLNRMLTPLTDAFIGVAAEHGRHLTHGEGFPPEKVHVIPNGVDTDRFCPRPEARARLRTELGVAVDVPLCGIVAALRPEKNHELFLRAAAGVRDQVPTAHFVIIGDGPRRGALEALARDLGILQAVHFLGSRNDVDRLLPGLDVFALTSHNEAFPVSILEAMSCGVPVVATQVGSVSEAVEDGATGHLIPPGDRAAATGRLADLLIDRSRARCFGRAARRRLLDRWSLEVMVRGYEQMVERIYASKVQPQVTPLRTPYEGQLT